MMWRLPGSTGENKVKSEPMFIVDDLILENYVPEYVDVTMPQTSGHYASYENLCSWILYIYNMPYCGVYAYA